MANMEAGEVKDFAGKAPPGWKPLEEIFKYHAPNDSQIPRYQKIRDAALAFAQVITECAPNGADKTAAIRKIREAVMTANAAIALE